LERRFGERNRGEGRGRGGEHRDFLIEKSYFPSFKKITQRWYYDIQYAHISIQRIQTDSRLFVGAGDID